MRIALYHNLPMGGASRALFEWVSRLSSRQVVDVHTLATAYDIFGDSSPVVRCTERYAFELLRSFRKPWGRLNQLQRWRNLGRLMQVAQATAAIIDQQRYDVVFANPCQVAQVPAILQYIQTPTIYFLHEPPGLASAAPMRRVGTKPVGARWLDRVDPLIMLYKRRLRRIQADCIHRASRLLANSLFTQGRVRTAFGVEAPVCFLGVDTLTFDAKPDLKRGRHVLSVGELSPRKGFDFLIESLAVIPPAARPKLRIASNSELPEERVYLERLASTRDVRVEMIGPLGSEELSREYAQAALFVYAPIGEPFGLAPLEAMACHTPVVGVRDGGVPESVVHEGTGVLVPRDPLAFADAVQRMLSNPALRDEYGRNAREHAVTNWTWDRSAEVLEQHLCAVASGSKPSGSPSPPLMEEPRTKRRLGRQPEGEPGTGRHHAACGASRCE